VDLQEQLIYGQQASEILENPVWKDVWSQYEKQIQQALVQTRVSDVDALQKGIQALQIMSQVKLRIEQALATGKMAEIQIRQKSRMGQAREWSRDHIGI
jgi:hypothetical protein